MEISELQAQKNPPKRAFYQVNWSGCIFLHQLLCSINNFFSLS